MLPLYDGALPAFIYAGQTTKIEAGKRGRRDDSGKTKAGE